MLVIATESSKPHHSPKGSETMNFKGEQSAHKKHQKSFSHQVSKFHVHYLQSALKVHRDANINTGLWFTEASEKCMRRDAITESNQIPLFPACQSS